MGKLCGNLLNECREMYKNETLKKYRFHISPFYVVSPQIRSYSEKEEIASWMTSPKTEKKKYILPIIIGQCMHYGQIFISSQQNKKNWA